MPSATEDRRETIRKQLFAKYMRTPRSRRKLLEAMIHPARSMTRDLAAMSARDERRHEVEKRALTLLSHAERLIGRMVLMNEFTEVSLPSEAALHLPNAREELRALRLHYLASRKGLRVPVDTVLPSPI